MLNNMTPHPFYTRVTYPFRVRNLSLHLLVLLWPTAHPPGSWAAWQVQIGLLPSSALRGGQLTCADVLFVAVTSPDLPAHLPSKLIRTCASWFVHFSLIDSPIMHVLNPYCGLHRMFQNYPVSHTHAKSLPLGVSEPLRAVSLLPELCLSSSLVLGNLNPAQGRVLTLENHVVLSGSKSSQ